MCKIYINYDIIVNIFNTSLDIENIHYMIIVQLH